MDLRKPKLKIFKCKFCKKIIETYKKNMKYCEICRYEKNYKKIRQLIFKEKIEKIRTDFIKDFKILKIKHSSKNGGYFSTKNSFIWGHKSLPNKEEIKTIIKELKNYVSNLNEDIERLKNKYNKNGKK